MELPACSICLENFSICQNLKLTKCGHVFHNDCIEKWMKSQSTCPQCRKDDPKLQHIYLHFRRLTENLQSTEKRKDKDDDNDAEATTLLELEAIRKKIRKCNEKKQKLQEEKNSERARTLMRLMMLLAMAADSSSTVEITILRRP